MLIFVAVATVLTLFALALLLWPLLASGKSASASRREANLAILRDERAAIERDVAVGTLSLAARDEALAELAERAEADLRSHDGETDESKRPVAAAIVIAAVLPIAALLIYLALGTPNALNADARVAPAATGGAKSPAEMSDTQIVAMVESLKAKMKERPDDPRGWQLLARSMVALDRFPEAVDAYRNLVRLQPNDPDALADLADALGVTQGGNLEGEPTLFVTRALAENPSHQKSLALAASAAMNRGDNMNAIALWQRLGATLAPDSDDRKQVDAMIADLRGKPAVGQSTIPVAGSAASTATVNPRGGANAASSAAQPSAASGSPMPGAITGSVSIAPALANRATPNAVVFVVARAVGPDAPRAPVAVYRTTVGALANGFTLDDSMAMAGVKLSATPQVEIEARVAKGGGAARQPGDLFGKVGPVAPGARVRVVIDQAVE